MGAVLRQFEVVVIGGGHAGVEAAWAAANAGADVALVTLDPGTMGVMSCNPAIGGLAKGQMVREIDAMGGLMGRVADATGIMFKTLNRSKGAAVRGPRAQCDKIAYAEEVRRLIATRAGISVLAASAEALATDGAGAGRVVRGVRLGSPDPALDGAVIGAAAVVLTTGTFMRGLMHTGASRTAGGRAGESPAVGMSEALGGLGFELGRLKTGTPPRLRAGTIDLDELRPDGGDTVPVPFSDLTERCGFPRSEQVVCHVTRTTAAMHELIRANLHRAPMYSGQIESAGPRYCPSIEDKVVRFADRDSHHVFLEPESHESDWVYCNGISTSLPADVQERLVRMLPGCARSEIVQLGYAVEYDMVRPHQIHATAMTKLVGGLFLAGQINGTSGYEEAAGQGLLAGLNASRHAQRRALVTLGRDEAYIGVMMDDLVTKTPVEPYRMFTSRAEHRLMLRSDNAADRLTPAAREWGLIGGSRWSVFERRRSALERVEALVGAQRYGDEPVAERLRRPGYTVADLEWELGAGVAGVGRGVLETVLAGRQYAGYIRRQQAEVTRHERMDRRRIPEGLDPGSIVGLRSEARHALGRFRPATFGQARRLEGVSPADISLLLVHVERHRRGDGSGGGVLL